MVCVYREFTVFSDRMRSFQIILNPLNIRWYVLHVDVQKCETCGAMFGGLEI